MISRTFSILGLFLITCTLNLQLNPTALGQYNHVARYQPPHVDGPPLFVRFAGPDGMKVTLFTGGGRKQTLVAPFMVGLRPGYKYRIEVSNMPNHPGLVIHPTLEVRGSLRGGPKVPPQEYPVTIRFQEDDFDRVERGSYLTKVVVLEDPHRAEPIATRPENPIQLEAPLGVDPMQMGLKRGAPIMLVQMGQRTFTERELISWGISGTILLPGQKVLGPAAAPPWLPWTCPSLYDPLHGPDKHYPPICLPDGGDRGLKVGYDRQGRLVGLDTADTVAEYVDSKGRKKIAISNRVCICVPRFILIRGELIPSRQIAVVGPNNMDLIHRQAIVERKTPPILQYQNIELQKLQTALRPSVAVATMVAMVFGQIDELDVMVSLKGPKGVTGSCLPTPKVPDLPLLLIKWPDKEGALVGEIVTFTLKYINKGGQPIRNVRVTDSLITRYEYVPGSAKSDRSANFTTRENDEGSLVLSWEINEDLPPGESGMVTFQVRIR